MTPLVGWCLAAAGYFFCSGVMYTNKAVHKDASVQRQRTWCMTGVDCSNCGYFAKACSRCVPCPAVVPCLPPQL